MPFWPIDDFTRKEIGKSTMKDGTWGMLKQLMEEAGVQDDDKIAWMDFAGSDIRPGNSLTIERASPESEWEVY